ncbi:MAG: hypothetical protein ABIK28_21425 [Planctomycetota bacterium]
MARIASGGPVGGQITYTFRALGNRDAPAGDRVTVGLRFPSEGDKRRAIRAELAARKGDGKAVGSDEYYDLWTLSMMRLSVAEVHGYDRMADGATVPIKTAEDFYEHAEPDFFRELMQVLDGEVSLTEEEKKTSDEPPASLNEAQGPSSGTAKNADETDSTNSAGTVAPLMD